MVRRGTRDAQPTCKYTINGSSGTNGVVVGKDPKHSEGQWHVQCYIENIECSGNGQVKSIACPAPEYPASNQEITGCADKWREKTLRFYLGKASFDGSSLAVVTDAHMLAACNATFATEVNAFTSDKAGRANQLCNQRAEVWTNQSKKAGICCVPNPVPPMNPPTPPGTDSDDLFIGPVVVEMGGVTWTCSGMETVPDGTAPPEEGAIETDPRPADCYEDCIVE